MITNGEFIMNDFSILGTVQRIVNPYFLRLCIRHLHNTRTILLNFEIVKRELFTSNKRITIELLYYRLRELGSKLISVALCNIYVLTIKHVLIAVSRNFVRIKFIGCFMFYAKLKPFKTIGFFYSL